MFLACYEGHWQWKAMLSDGRVVSRSWAWKWRESDSGQGLLSGVLEFVSVLTHGPVSSFRLLWLALRGNESREVKNKGNSLFVSHADPALEQGLLQEWDNSDELAQGPPLFPPQERSQIGVTWFIESVMSYMEFYFSFRFYFFLSI